jgi:hypothetical protein
MWVALLLVATLAQGAQQNSALQDPKFAETLKAFVASPESAPARKALDAVLALYPKDPGGPMEVGRQLLMQRDPKHAEEFLRRAVDLARRSRRRTSRSDCACSPRRSPTSPSSPSARRSS